MMRLMDITFTARKLNAKCMTRVREAEPGSLTAIIFSHMNVETGRNTRKTIIGKSLKNPLWRELNVKGIATTNKWWKKIEKEHMSSYLENGDNLQNGKIDNNKIAARMAAG